LRDSRQFKNGTGASLENAFQMAYPGGSPRGHLGDKPRQERKIEGRKKGNWKEDTAVSKTVEV